MDIIDKKILGAFYVSSITKESPVQLCVKKTALSEEYVSERILKMVKNELLCVKHSLDMF